MKTSELRAEKVSFFGAIVALCLCLVWFLQNPGFEPFLGMIGALFTIAGTKVFTKHRDIGLLLTLVGIVVIILSYFVLRREIDISGIWQRTLIDENGVTFDYEIVISQNRNDIEGRSLTRHSTPSLSKYYMRSIFKGQIQGKKIKFDETEFVEYSPEPNGVWCLASVNLTYTSQGDRRLLVGSYFDRKTSPQCGSSGRISIQKIK